MLCCAFRPICFSILKRDSFSLPFSSSQSKLVLSHCILKRYKMTRKFPASASVTIQTKAKLKNDSCESPSNIKTSLTARRLASELYQSGEDINESVVFKLERRQFSKNSVISNLKAFTTIKEMVQKESSSNMQEFRFKMIDKLDNATEFGAVKNMYGDETVEMITFDTDIEDRTSQISPLSGTENVEIPSSNVPCNGCGALLQCQYRTMPGFMISELFTLLSDKELKNTVCQRCYYIQHYDTFVEISTSPEEYSKMIARIRPTRAVVLMVVDVMDIRGSVVPNLMQYIGDQPLVIVGNKADLLAPDGPNYLTNVTKALKKESYRAGMKNIRKCALISAKTGFGIERLIDILFSFYKQRVNIFIVGTANAGKSSLFNRLIASDYCKHTARDLIQRATVSVWPGTTLNLLKFPIMRPSLRTSALRYKRLKQEEALEKERKRSRLSRKKTGRREVTWELTDDIQMTDIRTENQIEEADAPWGQEVVTYEARPDGSAKAVLRKDQQDPFEEENYSDSYWAFDTPGVINPDQLMNLLTPEEAPHLSPASMIVPRCLQLKPSSTIFLSGLSRVDYVQGNEAIVVAAHCSSSLPIHVCHTEEADEFYLKHVGTDVLGIPLGGHDRLMRLPSLVGKSFVVKGISPQTAAVDIQLSSLGWISVVLNKNTSATLRAYSPGGRGLHVRKHVLLPNLTAFRGKRVSGSPFYRTKPQGSAMAGKELVKGDLYRVPPAGGIRRL